MDMKEYEKQVQILKILTEMQNDGCAPIEVSIGYTSDSGIVMKGILLKSAPPVVAHKLVYFGYSLDITSEGVRVFN